MTKVLLTVPPLSRGGLCRLRISPVSHGLPVRLQGRPDSVVDDDGGPDGDCHQQDGQQVSSHLLRSLRCAVRCLLCGVRCYLPG